MAFERNYQVRIPSNLVNTLRNNYSIMSTLSESELTINPWYVTGFTDGEGCFIVTIIKDNKYKLGLIKKEKKKKIMSFFKFFPFFL